MNTQTHTPTRIFSKTLPGQREPTVAAAGLGRYGTQLECLCVYCVREQWERGFNLSLYKREGGTELVFIKFTGA